MHVNAEYAAGGGWIGAAALSMLIGVAASFPVQACDYVTMRDAAFDEPRDVHRLCVIGNTGDPEAAEIMTRLETWLKAPGVQDLNLELVFLPADDPKTPWLDYAIPSAPPSVPVVVLVGRKTLERKSFLIDYWEPAPTDADLEAMAVSPAREAIRQRIGQQLAVMIYAPAQPAGEPAIETALAEVTDKWQGDEWRGVSTVTVDRTDPRERLLLSFAGIRPDDPAWVAVVFGRGKFMPPLVGEDVTAANLHDVMQMLVGECTCLRSPRTMGVDIPMVWEESLDKSVIRLKSEDDPQREVPAGPALAIESQSSSRETVISRSAWALGIMAVVAGCSGMLVWRSSRRLY